MNENKQAPAAPIKTWRERIGVGADFPLHGATDVERAMEAEIAELRTAVLPFDEHTKYILGRPNFTCIRAAGRLRELGHDIAYKAEAEQAAVLHLMLTMYQKHGADWLEKSNTYLADRNGHPQDGGAA